MGRLLGKQRNRHGLGEASTSQIRDWVKRMKAQEGGIAPDIHKVNANMAWYERTNTNHPMYQLYMRFNKDSRQFLDHVKSKVPGEFGLTTAPDDSNSRSRSSDDNDTTDSNDSSGGGSSGDNTTPDPVGPTPCGPTGCPPGYNCVDGECVDEQGNNPEPKYVKAEGQDSNNKDPINQVVEPLKKVDKKVWYGVGIGFALMLLMRN